MLGMGLDVSVGLIGVDLIGVIVGHGVHDDVMVGVGQVGV